MATFNGFKPGAARKIWLPEQFFSDLLPQINDLAELKLTLFCFWALHQQDGTYRYLRHADLLSHAALRDMLAGITPGADPAQMIEQALARACGRGTLLAVQLPQERIYFLNTETGRSAAARINAGDWRPTSGGIEILAPRPSVFDLYEANIGPITPMIAEHLKNAEQDYPAAWLAEAIALAVEHNKRSWAYVRAILQRWDTEGRSRETTERDHQSDAEKYISGPYAAFIKFRPDE